MKHSFLIYTFTFFLGACHSAGTTETPTSPRTLAVAATVTVGVMQETEAVPATTIYLEKSQLSSPVAGYIEAVRVKPGDAVYKGQLLYLIESKEKKALGVWPDPATAGNVSESDSVPAGYGVFRVLAAVSGFVTRMDKQQAGDFVTEGFPLCAIADPHTVLFQLDIPYEQVGLVRTNSIFRIDLPDGNPVKARITGPLTQVKPGSQAASFLARPDTRHFLPEGLIASARLITYRKKAATLLPLKAVLSDELMHSFWVMKLLNDSVAVKLPVTIGRKNDSLVEILQPALSLTDRVLTEGNYGLADTALVTIRPATFRGTNNPQK